MYKVLVGIVDEKCLQREKMSNTAMWHARLGHIGRDTMNTMANKEMVVGLPKLIAERETCFTCLHGKQARVSFPQATTYRAEKH